MTLVGIMHYITDMLWVATSFQMQQSRAKSWNWQKVLWVVLWFIHMVAMHLLESNGFLCIILSCIPLLDVLLMVNSLPHSRLVESKLYRNLSETLSSLVNINNSYSKVFRKLLQTWVVKIRFWYRLNLEEYSLNKTETPRLTLTYSHLPNIWAFSHIYAKNNNVTPKKLISWTWTHTQAHTHTKLNSKTAHSLHIHSNKQMSVSACALVCGAPFTNASFASACWPYESIIKQLQTLNRGDTKYDQFGFQY